MTSKVNSLRSPGISGPEAGSKSQSSKVESLTDSQESSLMFAPPPTHPPRGPTISPAGTNRDLCFDMCWARGTYSSTWVWCDYNVTQYGLSRSRSKLPGVTAPKGPLPPKGGRAATPEASPMSFGLLTAEHEGEEGANNWSDGGVRGADPPRNAEGGTGGDKGR